MNSQEFLEVIKKIQENILLFLENEANLEESFQNLSIILQDQKICDDKLKLTLLLHLILKISNNHHHGPNFFGKLEQILNIFKDSIKKNFTNSEILSIFKSNKRILLFLIQENIIIVDKYFIQKILRSKKYMDQEYLQYFAPEIEPFIKENWFSKKVPKL